MKREGKRGDVMLMGRMVAGVDLLGRTGVREVEIAYDDERNDMRVPVVWWATGKWNGARVDSELFPYPAQAVEDLLTQVINGGHCRRCDKTTVIGIDLGPDYCCFQLVASDVDDDQAYRYVRTCERTPA